MGGKRPDPFNDPAEGNSTNRSVRGEGRSGDEPVEDEQKANVSEREQRPKTPDAGTKAAPREEQDKKAGIAKREDTTSDFEDRVDEASEESFPASDPPAY